MNDFNKLLPPRQLRIPLLGLFLILGGVFAYHSKPVLSTQMEYLRTFTVSNSNSHAHNWLQRNLAFDGESFKKEARLRKRLGLQSSQNMLHRRSLQSSWTARLHRNHHQQAITKSIPSSHSSLIASNTGQTYTWIQRNPSELLPKSSVSRAPKTATIVPKGSFPQQNGVYLYGQSPQAGQLGQGYIIFDKQQRKILGALYIPGSEFSCFNGTLYPSGELAMTVKGYVGDSSLTQVATNNTLPHLSEDEPTTYSHSVKLQDYYQLHALSAKDRQMLQMCKANLGR